VAYPEAGREHPDGLVDPEDLQEDRGLRFGVGEERLPFGTPEGGGAPGRERDVDEQRPIVPEQVSSSPAGWLRSFAGSDPGARRPGW